jgi:SAM-dependent methyltransferase
MPLSLSTLHARYTQQAGWTAALRRHLFDRLQLDAASRVLEVGCGTGAVLSTLEAPAKIHGLDIHLPSLQLTQLELPAASLAAGDAHRLPYASDSFDVAFSHFVLLWLADPLQALAEMRRVTRLGGAVLALAEPEYGGRIDHPPALEVLGRLQADALRAQGADPELGRHLVALFHQAGFSEVESGVLGAEWPAHTSAADIALEHQMLRADLGASVAANELEALLAADRAAWEAGERILYVPTFYAWGRVPSKANP